VIFDHFEIRDVSPTAYSSLVNVMVVVMKYVADHPRAVNVDGVRGVLVHKHFHSNRTGGKTLKYVELRGQECDLSGESLDVGSCYVPFSRHRATNHIVATAGCQNTGAITTQL